MSKPSSAQETIQDSSPPNNESLSEFHSFEPTNSSSSPKEKSLRPRTSKQKTAQTPRSKTRSRKRNVFTEDEEDEEGKERYLFCLLTITRYTFKIYLSLVLKIINKFRYIVEVPSKLGRN